MSELDEDSDGFLQPHVWNFFFLIFPLKISMQY